MEPLSITVKIKKNKDTSALMSSDSKSITKKIDGKQSKFHINISCEKLSLKLQQYQIKEIMRFSDSINVSEYYVLHLFLQKYRPTESPTKNPRAWWKYALKYVQAVINPGKLDLPSLAYKKSCFSWVTLLKLLADQQKYIKLMKRKEGAPWLAKFAETNEVALLEDSLLLNKLYCFEDWQKLSWSMKEKYMKANPMVLM